MGGSSTPPRLDGLCDLGQTRRRDRIERLLRKERCEQAGQFVGGADTDLQAQADGVLEIPVAHVISLKRLELHGAEIFRLCEKYSQPCCYPARIRAVCGK